MPRAKKKETEAPAGAVTETVQRMPLSELHPFEGHPFKVLDDDSMTETVESIRQMGVANPLIVRPDPDGGYEIISGHRRRHAAELAGLDTIPVIVRELDDDAAVIMMVDSNLQRENILPSERAKAYKMKLEALKHQGQRHDLTSTQVVEKLAAEQVGDDAGISRESVRRFVRLTELIPEILDMVDEKKISMTPAVKLSRKEKRPSVLKALAHLKELAKSIPSKVREKNQERER